MGNTQDTPENNESSASGSAPEATKPGPKSSKECQKLTDSESRRNLIKEVWANSKRQADIGTRIFGRVFFKRPDLRLVFDAISKQTWSEESKRFGQLLEEIIPKIDDIKSVESVCEAFGKSFVPYKQHGFRPDYLVAFSEAIISECLYLDDSKQFSASESTDAWSNFVSVIISSMREGYYAELRNQRKLLRKLSSKSLSFPAAGRSPEQQPFSRSGTGTGITATGTEAVVNGIGKGETCIEKKPTLGMARGISKSEDKPDPAESTILKRGNGAFALMYLRKQDHVGEGYASSEK